jgi:hypothetical protein
MRENKCPTIDQLASRHIAKLLTRLGDTVAPVQQSEIKRQIRFLAEDIKQVNTNTEISDHEQEQNTAGNR